MKTNKMGIAPKFKTNGWKLQWSCKRSFHSPSGHSSPRKKLGVPPILSVSTNSLYLDLSLSSNFWYLLLVINSGSLPSFKIGIYSNLPLLLSNKVGPSIHSSLYTSSNGWIITAFSPPLHSIASGSKKSSS